MIGMSFAFSIERGDIPAKHGPRPMIDGSLFNQLLYEQDTQVNHETTAIHDFNNDRHLIHQPGFPLAPGCPIEGTSGQLLPPDSPDPSSPLCWMPQYKKQMVETV